MSRLFYFFVLFQFFINISFSQSTITEVDSLEILLQAANRDEKPKLLNHLSEKYWKQETPKAYLYAIEAKRIALENSDSVNYALALHNIGRYYYIISEYDKSLEIYLSALKIGEELNDISIIGQVYNSIGLTYWQLSEYDRALEKFNIAMSFFQNLNDNDKISATINNIGIIYIEKKEYQTGLVYFEKSLKQAKEIRNKSKEVVALNNMGYAYENLDLLSNALHYTKASYSLADSLGLLWDKSNALINMGRIYYKTNTFYKADEALSKALEIAQTISAKNLVVECLMVLTELRKKQKKYAEALQYYEKYTLVKDSLLNEQKNKLIANIQVQFNNIKEENKYEIQKKELEIATLKLNRQNLRLILLGIILLLGVGIFLILYRGYNSKKKASVLLKKQNREIIRQNEEILKQAEDLKRTNLDMAKLSLVASETSNAVIIMDTNYDIEWINPGFTRMFGFTLEQLLAERGKNLLEISGNKDIYQKLKKVLFEKKTIIYEAYNEKRNGDKIWVQTTITPIIDKEGNVSQLIAIDSDISKIKDAEKEMIKQRDEIFHQKKEITDSIIYSKRIQNAILTSNENIVQIIPESFIIYIPREIIGGDFYWMKKINGVRIIAVADCTGHGVPGALMSMLGITLLNEIVEKKGITVPGEILNELRREIIRVLHQTEEKGSNDGMDIAICAIQSQNKILKYAGANNPLIIANNKRILELKPDKMPISLYIEKERSFFTQEVEIENGDMIYMYTDGFIDQFGGQDGKKFFKQNLLELIKETSVKNCVEQKAYFESTFYSWKGDEHQLDDVCLLGFRISDDIK